MKRIFTLTNLYNILYAYCTIHGLDYKLVDQHPDLKDDPQYQGILAVGFDGVSPPRFVVGLAEDHTFAVVIEENQTGVGVLDAYTAEEFVDLCKIHL